MALPLRGLRCAAGTRWAARQRHWRIQRRSAQTWGDEEPPIFRPKTASKTRKGLHLPEGWREIISPSRGAYYAHDSGATQFEFPKGPPSSDQVRRAQNERGERYGHRTDLLGPGATVRLFGLERFPQLEGKTGTCVQLDTDGYVRVRLDSGELKAVKMKNLMLVTPPVREPRPPTGQEEAKAPPKPKAKSFLRWPALGATGFTVVLLYQYYQLSEHDRSVAEQKDKASSPPPSSPPELEPLPAGWCQHVDPSSGRLYYWQEADPSNTVTWERPKVTATSEKCYP